VAWWRGEGNGNDSADGHNGTPGSAVSYTQGVFGQAFNFPGGNTSRVYVPDSGAFKLTDSLSIAAWANPRTAGDMWYILHRGDNRSGRDPYYLQFLPGGVVKFGINDAAGNYDDLLSPTSVALYQWHQITGTLDGSTGDMRLYVDGVLAAEKYTPLRAFADLDPTRDPSVGIGNASGHSIDFGFVGYVDEVLLYSRALSASEVMALAVPEPSPFALAGLGAATLCFFRRHK
jgi:hypothetical protein